MHESLRYADYRRALSGAPFNKQGNGPDRSKADFMWAKWSAERGWNADEIAAELLKVSDKAKEHAARGDTGYTALTAGNAVAVVERERGRRAALKSTPRP